MQRDDFDQMKGQIHRLMGEFFKDAKPLGYQSDQCFHPPMDIYETEDNLVVVMEIAGMRTEDIHVFFEKDLLSITGGRTESSSAPKTRLHQMEIDYGDFERTLRIPFPLKVDEIRAAYRQGFLIITVPKRKEPIFKTVEVSVR
ncbi:MAG: Hsp20/alpha crystallin family protein [Thermodesulfobacteriota bacterium]|jgi:HSP20 family protein